MKKIIVLILFLHCILVVKAQPIVDLDNAVIGTGINQHNYSGSGWTHAISSSDPYLNNTLSFSNTTNDYVTISFKGSKVEIYTRIAHHHGIAAVSLDNGTETLVDLYAYRQPPASFRWVYSSGEITEGNHTLKIRVTGTKNSLSTGTYVVLDYIKVYSQAAVQQSNTSLGYQALFSNTSGFDNTATGTQALFSNTTGAGNTANGSYTLNHNTTGGQNTATGAQALYNNTTGSFNNAFGYKALFSNTTGNRNTASGFEALYFNTTGGINSAFGYYGLHDNTTGSENTAIGWSALQLNKNGNYNTAVGVLALQLNISGERNTGVGHEALLSNQTGFANSALGRGALRNNTTGSFNVGISGLSSNQTGSNNTGVGSDALYINYSGSGNTAIGSGALMNNTTGNNNTALGSAAGPAYGFTNLGNSTAVGYQAITTASNQVRIGNSSVTSIGGQVSWSTLSDGRFKNDIKEDVSGLEFIKQLRPVSYTVDKDKIDKFLRVPDSVRQQREKSREKIVRQTGFVAQEVESLVKKTGYVFSGVEAPKNENDHYSIRYAEFVVPLVKAMQELAAKVETQEKIAETQQKKIEVLVEQLKKYGVSTEGLLSTDEVELFQNNPNPFSLDTEIKMTLPETALQAKVIVYNMEGKQLRDLTVKGRGKTSVKISGSELSEGMYLYALIVDGRVVDTKRMILTK